MAAPGPQLTEWENSSIQAIDRLLTNCQIRNAEFNHIHQLLNTPNQPVQTADEWMRFRSLMIDLYSVLDYICFLLYCHYQNDGKYDSSDRSRNVKFPKSNKLNHSQFPGQENPAQVARENWKQKQAEIIFGYGPFPRAEDYDLYNEVSKFFLDVQEITEVDAAGEPIESNLTESSDIESFKLLHFFRNCSVHRDLIRFTPQPGVLYINNVDPKERKFCSENEGPPGWFVPVHCQIIVMAKGFWIEYPIVKPLLHVVTQLITFVKLFRANIIRKLPGCADLQYLDTQWRWDGLTVGNQFTSWNNYMPVLNRYVL